MQEYKLFFHFSNSDLQCSHYMTQGNSWSQGCLSYWLITWICSSR